MSEHTTGGLPPREQERTPEEIITAFKSDFEKYLQEDPEIATVLKKEILNAAGLSEDELVDKSMNFDFGLVKIPIDQLGRFGTSCGAVGNKAFTEKIVEYIRSLHATFIIGLSHNKEFTISSAAIPISENDGHRLER